MTTFSKMMKRIPDNLDKRQGSTIHDTLATTAIEIDNLKIETEIFKDQTYLLTSTGINLDNRAMDFNITRFQTTRSVRIAEFTSRLEEPYNVNIGDRFATPNDANNVTFTVFSQLEDGKFLLICDIFGTLGNQYQGSILPLTPQNTLGTATITGTQIPAQDTETDDNFRARVIEMINNKAFGGNLADYRQRVREIDGVGDVRVIPVPQGAKTVKLIVVSSDYQPVTSDFIDFLQNYIDPDDRDYENRTGGIGIAPIWHFVDITTPNRIYVDISVTLTLNRVDLLQIERLVNQKLEEVFNSLRRSWANSDSIGVFIATISCALLQIDEVINVTNILINGLSQDLNIDNNDIPFLGEVVLSAN